MYTAVILTEDSRQALYFKFKDQIPAGWESICHHMTINMGPAEDGPAALLVGQRCTVLVRSFARDDKVMAVGVDSLIPSTNEIKHITVAVNRTAGGKPFMSNKLNNWEPVEPFVLNGVVGEE